jgi:hypothetical protein
LSLAGAHLLKLLAARPIRYLAILIDCLPASYNFAQLSELEEIWLCPWSPLIRQFVARGDKARPRVTLDFASFEDSLKLVKEKTFGRDTVVKYDRIWGLEELIQGVKANMIASNKESSSARSLTIIAKIMIPHFRKAEL